METRVTFAVLSRFQRHGTKSHGRTGAGNAKTAALGLGAVAGDAAVAGLHGLLEERGARVGGTAVADTDQTPLVS